MFNPKNISIFATLLVIIGLVGSFATYRSIPKQETMTEKLENIDFNNIEINASNAEVSIEQTNDQNPYVEISGYNLENNFSKVVKNDRLSIAYEEKTKKFFNFGLGQKAVQIQLYIPKENYDTIIAEANNGKIHVSNIRANRMNVKTNNGSINLKKSQVNELEMNAKNGKLQVEQLTGEMIQLAADNGRLHVKDVQADSVKVSSKNGKIELEQVSGEITAQSNNGKIHYVTKALQSSLDFVAKNGKIHIETLEEPTNVDIHAQARNGSVKIFNEKTNNKTFGTGEHKIQLQSNNGKIIVE